MEKYNVLLGYFDRQLPIVSGLFDSIKDLDLNIYENRYVYALKSQQIYTAIEDIFKVIIKTFENNIDDYSKYHVEILKVLSVDIPNIRPRLLSEESLKILDKLRSFRHFIRHAYNTELDLEEMILLQKKCKASFGFVIEDFKTFINFVKGLSSK